MAGSRILLIDNSFGSESIKKILEEEDYLVTQVEDLQEARKDCLKFNIILIDLFLPWIKGEQLVQEFREKSKTIIIIAVTARCEITGDCIIPKTEMGKEFLLHILDKFPVVISNTDLDGINCIIQKPFRPELLIHVLNYFSKKKKPCS